LLVPILLGREAKIRQLIEDNVLDLDDVLILDPKSDEQRDVRNQFGEILFDKRKRKGLSLPEGSKADAREELFWFYDGRSRVWLMPLFQVLAETIPSTLRPSLTNYRN
jgi:malate dehydrogenase (oxaloacetate-decarboxylating)(NADP+)